MRVYGSGVMYTHAHRRTSERTVAICPSSAAAAAAATAAAAVVVVVHGCLGRRRLEGHVVHRHPEAMPVGRSVQRTAQGLPRPVQRE